MKRRAHWLRGNKGVELPTHCIFYDTETKSHDIDERTEHARLWFGWACYTRRHRNTHWTKPTWVRFRTGAEFWRWVGQHKGPNRKLYLFAHNTGFDFTILKGFGWAKRLGWKCTGKILDDPPTIIRFRKEKETLCFVDTLNYFRTNLKELGEMVGLSKLEMPEEGRSIEDWDEYCRTDVLIMLKAMQAFWAMVQQWELGNFAYTLPAQAFAAFRHRFMKYPIFIDDNEFATELARKGYVGARTECFKIGRIQDPVHCLDINSQYPFVMATTPVPTRLITTRTIMKLEELYDLCMTNCVVAAVSVDTSLPLYPKKIPGWTIMPVGQFRTTLNTPELSLALTRGDVRAIHKVAVYEKAVIFRDYVNFFYEKRMEAKKANDETLATLLKLFLNSLYGKFGQRGYNFEKRYETNNPVNETWLEWDANEKCNHRYRRIDGIVEELQRESESRESFPAIAGHITSAGRILLLDYIYQAGEGNTFYCDTDSLFVNDRGLANLGGRISENQLGWLKHEWSSDDVTIHGCKDYQIGDKTKRKGIRKDAVILDPSTYRQVQFRGLKGMIQDGDMNRILIRQVTKHLARTYAKGTVEESGRVSPLRFPHPDYPELEE